jgi:protein SFI1
MNVLWKLRTKLMAGILQRIVSDVLRYWTSRVVEIRSREIEVRHGRDSKILAAALSKWVGVLHRRAEDGQLADSFKDVKKDGEWQR